MAEATQLGDLFPQSGVPEGAIVVNERCLVRTQDGHRIVLVAGIPLAQYTLGDAMAEAHAMVSLVEQGWADQNDVGRRVAIGTAACGRAGLRDLVGPSESFP